LYSAPQSHRTIVAILGICAYREPDQAEISCLIQRSPLPCATTDRSKIVKEIEFAAALPPLEIRRISIDLMFENFERNETHLWPREDDTRGARHEVQVIADDGSLRKADIRQHRDVCYRFCCKSWLQRNGPLDLSLRAAL
jgi:hypothetical protein